MLAGNNTIYIILSPAYLTFLSCTAPAPRGVYRLLEGRGGRVGERKRAAAAAADAVAKRVV